MGNISNNPKDVGLKNVGIWICLKNVGLNPKDVGLKNVGSQGCVISLKFSLEPLQFTPF